MPLITNQDDYLKFYIDESLSLFDKIKKNNKKRRINATPSINK